MGEFGMSNIVFQQVSIWGTTNDSRSLIDYIFVELRSGRDSFPFIHRYCSLFSEETKSKNIELSERDYRKKLFDALEYNGDVAGEYGKFIKENEKVKFIPSKETLYNMKENRGYTHLDNIEKKDNVLSFIMGSSWAVQYEFWLILALLECEFQIFYIDDMREFAGVMNFARQEYIDNFKETPSMDICKELLPEKLLEIALGFVSAEDLSGQNLSGQNIVFTGTMSQSRTKMKKEAEEAGAKVLSDVSSKVDLLVCGAQIVHNATNAKYNKAKKLDIEIIEEEEYRQRFFSGENEDIFEEEEEKYDKEAFFAFYTKSKLTDILDELGDTDYRSSWKKSKLVSLILEYTIKDILSSFTSNELKEGLERLSLSSTGRKNERYKRLCDALA